MRLGTGDQGDPSRFFDQEPGDGQIDLEGNVFGLLEMGDRFGAWGQVRYGVQNEGNDLPENRRPGRGPCQLSPARPP